MSSFFYHTAQTLLNQYTDRFPLLKITQLLDWQAIEQTLANHKVNYVRKQRRSSCLSVTTDVPRHFARTMAQFV